MRDADATRDVRAICQERTDARGCGDRGDMALCAGTRVPRPSSPSTHSHGPNIGRKEGIDTRG